MVGPEPDSPFDNLGPFMLKVSGKDIQTVISRWEASRKPERRWMRDGQNELGKFVRKGEDCTWEFDFRDERDSFLEAIKGLDVQIEHIDMGITYC